MTGQLQIGAASLRTGIRKRDEHLRSPDFFDVQAFPSIAVSIESAEATQPGWVSLRAQLTVKGVQRELELPPTSVQTARVRCDCRPPPP